MTEDDELETDLEVTLIVAVAENGVIGRDGEMPWHIPADLKHFKRETTGHPVIMGRITYESILEGLGEPLPGRTSIVLTSRDIETPENVVLARDLEDALEKAQEAAETRHDGADRVYVAGGGTVYEQFLPAADRLVVTEVEAEPDGDTRFPAWDDDEWREVSRDDRDDVAFVEYVSDNS
ncbi:dihydrofolate reductase [Natrialbaceae archaeon A-gly3]